MLYSEEQTVYMQASKSVTGKPAYTGQIIYTFIGGRLANTKPPASKPIKKISALFRTTDFGLESKHVVVEMNNGLITGKEVKTI